ncbi:hypothetical protein [Thetidibacter halocola]|uniref:Excalibur calcium-binding domain-containing protein n=1 Tax=Thetidibacter halocola TaxID=2827239 RepID=A0A8J7WEA4_9RHOB|nr:hypothetical protein [Thetidibacter halocola]MBS0125187.1 hypothetical protein [Thetidibacter halocola]
MRFLLLGVAGIALLGCAPGVPDSAAGVVDPGRGVGFQNYDAYAAARDAQLAGGGSGVTTVPGPIDVQGQSLDAADSRSRVAAAAANSGVLPLDASPSNPPPQVIDGPAPQVVSNAAGISAENDFDAVSSERDIQADAALLARNRAQYTVVQPTDLPTRPGTSAPNIVEYALRTTNPVGTPLYSRSAFASESRSQRACAGYASADLAQEEFLALGGPEKDRKGLDPDGDGFACGWNPAPFRAVRGG